MKRKITQFILCIGASIVILSNSAGPAYNNPFGNYTGSPGTIGTCDDCHGGNGSTTDAFITITDKQTGQIVNNNQYEPNKSYLVNITGINTNNLIKYGFQSIVLSNNDTSVGNIIPTMNFTAVRNLNNNKKIIEQTQTLVASNANNLPAYYEWVAPPQGTGIIKFYSVVNAVNGNGDKYGDNANCNPSVLTLTEKTSSIFIAENNIDLKIFPNPTHDVFQIILNDNSIKGISGIKLYSLNGKTIKTLDINKNEPNLVIDISTLPIGYYIGVIPINGICKYFRIIKE